MLKFLQCALCVFLCSCAPENFNIQTLRDDLKYDDTKNIGGLSTWWSNYQDPQLNELIQKGISESPNIKEALARVEKSNALAIASGASLMPSVVFDGSIEKYRQTYNNGLPLGVVPKGFQSAAQAQLAFQYEFDFWNKNDKNFQAFKLENQASLVGVKQAKIMISTSIANIYAELDHLYKQLDVAKDSVEIRSKTLQLFLKRFKEGLENESSVEQSKSHLATAQANVYATEEQIELSKNKILVLVGDIAYDTKKIKRPKLNVPCFQKLPKLHLNLIASRPDVISSKLILEAFFKRIDVAKAGYYPNITFGAYFGRQSIGLDVFLNRSSLIAAYGPAIHLPIFNKDALDGAYQNACAEYHIYLAQYESAILLSMNEIADALTSIKALDAQIKEIDSALSSAQKAYIIAKDRYHGGLSTYLEVLRAEDTLLSAKLSMANIQSNVFVLNVKLIKALGGHLPL